MIKEKLLELLSKKFPGFSPSEPFGKQMDSLQLVELVKEIELHFGIEIHGIELDDDNFQNLESIEALVRKKMG